MWPIPYKFIITGFFLLSIICFAGFKNLNTFTPPEVDVKNHVADKLHELKGVTKALQTTVVNKTAGLPSIQKKFFTLREIYKEVEFLICYLDAEVGEHFNGANLVSGDPDILSTKMIEPRGMQVMEEILFSDEEEKDLTAMAVLCTQMLEDITLFEKQLNKTPITTTMLFDASRKEVLRIAFLGLTGFDSPVAKNSIPEAITALQAVQKVIKAYSASIQNEKLLNDVNNTFEEAILYLQKNTDFNSFDRAHFIREYSNVLYSMLLDVHNAVGAVYPETLTDFNIPVNYEARNPFSENFLNAHFYNSNKTDNPTDARIVLGKTLFFDPVLSVNTKRACASCHQPGKAFTDGLAKSLALDFSGTVKRNAPTVINAALQGSYFYDVRA
ncbi:MAG: cytochrome-c peroxidase, partial [Chitinophagales bacterium]